MREIAVVGLACRFPNGLDSIDQLWDALVDKRNTAGEIPADRWEADRFFSADEKAKGMSYVKRGNFLKQDVRSFDAGFFDIPPKMAENLDPQQRLLLEVVWEAFENAGLDLTAHAGKPVGVYVGGFMLDHMVNQMQPANRALNNQNTAAGMMMTMLSNRISHAFDLRGPSLSIDTACSSSLVAFNYACQDIWNGTCDMAIVGGANVMTRPEYPIGMSKGHFLARDGQCKSFDARGDGYGRGEGAGIVLLKSLDRALADGDTILATVAGTGANSDGRTPGISMPSADAQRQLIVDVCERFQINPSDVRYVECHGTGTAVGDPIEANSVGSVYGAGKSGDDRLVVGTIKSNIGHLEAAAGIAGVIKAVLSLMHGRATPLANLQTPHPDIPFDALGIRLADDLITLDNGGRPVLAAVNSFGYGGTNAHAVLRTAAQPMMAATVAETATATASRCCCDAAGQRAFPYFLPISARSPGALKALAQRYANRLQERDPFLDDIVHSAARRRAHLTHRAVVIGDDRPTLVGALQALAAGESSEALCLAVQPYAGRREPVFVYTGMGPQWWGMGQGLYRHQPIYRQAVDDADAIFQRIAGFSILAEMLKDEADSLITRTHLAQPANFIVQLGVTAILRAAGVQPGAIVGHSVGEVSSAYAAGALSLEEALSVSFHRSRLQATTAGTGSMLAVGLSEEAVKPWLAEYFGQVDIAAVNGPTTITLAGDSQAIEALSGQLTQAEVFNRALTVEVAYHSHLMDPILAELATALAHLSPRTPSVPLYSTVTGERVEGDAYGADYWPLNVRRPVAFMKAINALLDDGYTTFIEVGPHPVLSSALRDCAKAVGKEIRLVETLRRSDADECQRVMRGVAGVHAAGCDIDWGRLCAPARFVSLPNYPWQRERFWLESERGALERVSPLTLPMLGMQEIPASHMWRTDLENEALRYLKEHVVSGMSLMPAAGYLESLFELSALLHPQASSHVLRQVEIAAPLLISADRSVDYVTAYDARARTVAIRSTENGKVGEGQTHVVAEIGVPAADEPLAVDLAALVARFDRHEDVERYYKSLAGIGLQYGVHFQTIRSLSVHREAGEVLARLELDEREQARLARYQAHPTLMDGCFQTLFGMLDGSTTYLPIGFEELRLHRALPARLWCHGVLVERSAKRVECDILLYDDDGRLLGVVRGLRAVAATAKPGRVDQYGDAVKRQVLTYGWTVAGRLSEPKRLGHWLVVEQPGQALAQDLVDRLEAYGARVTGRLRFGAQCIFEGPDLTVRSGQPDDIAGALAHLGRLDGVAFLHGLAATPGSDDPVAIDAISGIAGVTQALMKLPLEDRPRVYAVTQSAFQVEEYDAPVSPGQTGINGFVRVAFNELEGLRFTSIDLPGEGADEQIDALAFELLCDAAEDEVALRRQSRFFSELQETPVLDQARIAFQPVSDDKPVLVRPAQDKDESTGTIKLVQALHGELAPDAIELRIEALGLPISILSDPSSDVLDQAFVDVVATVSAVGGDVRDLEVGARVCGFAPSDIGSHLRGRRRDFHLVEVDTALTAADLVGTIAPGACGVRLAELADVEAGAQVLVYADVKGVSLARELQRAGAQVVLVVEPGALEKLVLPAGVQVCAASHDQIERFARATPAGFDVVAAPMANWSDRFGLRCLRVGGTLIDTAEKSLPTKLPSHAASMVRGDLAALSQRPAGLVRALARCVALLAAGEIEPIRNLTISAIDLAWQKLESPNQDVQVVLTFGHDVREAPVHLQDRIAFHAEASYLVTGGFGGFGQKTAQWLVEHGARHLVLVGRTGADTEERREFVRSLEDAGVRVLAAACDTADSQGMAGLLAEIDANWPPLRGIFHSAAVIIDQAIADLDQGTFAKVMRNKAQSAWVMHQLTRDLPLDHFVMYSSVANSVGNSRQASYSAANGFIDGLAWHRKAMGLAATSVNWGAISDVGVVTRDEKLEQFLRYIGLRGITSLEGLTLMGQALQRDVTQFGVTVITNWGDWARYETLGGKSPRFASLIAADVNPADAAVRERLRAELAALPAPERFGVLAALIVEVIAGELQTTAESISIDRPINELGVDSLMGTEIQLVLESDLGIAVSVLELLGDTSIRTITDRTLKDLDLGALEVVEVSLPG